MEPTPPPNPDALRSAQGAAASPDPVTADLLAKHSAGDRLTAQEYGKLGAFKKKVANFFGAKGGATPGSPQLGLAPGDAARMGAVATPEASADRLAVVPVDSGVARRVAGAVLTRSEAITVRWIERHAAKAGATGAALDRFRDAARFTVDDRALIVDLTPDVFAELGIDARKSPLITVGAVLGLHVTNLWLAVDELKELAKQRETPAPAKPTSPTPTPPAGVAPTDPPRPSAPGGDK